MKTLTLLLTAILLAVLLLGASVPAMAANKWEESDTTLLVLRFLDWAQTRDIATELNYDNGFPVYDVNTGKQEFRFSEANPILGTHPSIEQVNTYFIILIGADFVICKYGSPKFKQLWKIIGNTAETYCITQNISVGVSFKF